MKIILKPILTLLFLCLIFCSGKNLSPAIANMPSNPTKLMDKTFTQRGFKYSIPQINGLQNQEIQNKSNFNIKQVLLFEIDPPEPKSSLDGKSKIIFQNKKLIVFQYEGLYMWPQAPHPLKINEAINMDLTTGKIYKLKDLFKQNIDYKSELKKIIKAHETSYRFKNNETGYYKYFSYEDFIENFEDIQFVMHKDYLHLYYMGPYAVGEVEGYKIPYNDLKNLIDNNGKLWLDFIATN